MLWIGLTGGIASGKSTVSELIRQSGVPVVDADQLSREAVLPGSPVFKQVVQHFGPEVVLPSGELNRVELGRLIFADENRRLLLESFIHPYVQGRTQDLRRQYKSQGHGFAFYDVPLLYEKKLEAQFDDVVLVYCDETLQRERLGRFRQMSEADIDRRLSAQIPLIKKLSSNKAYVIYNNSSLQDLAAAVKTMIQFYRQKTGSA